jgi:endonuclease YncB( thermonuclease family)
MGIADRDYMRSRPRWDESRGEMRHDDDVGERRHESSSRGKLALTLIAAILVVAIASWHLGRSSTNGQRAATHAGGHVGIPPDVVSMLAKSKTGEPLPTLDGTVLDVIDGDSLIVRLASGPIEVRMHSVDAPEHDQPGGAAARKALRKRVKAGATVSLEPIEQDRYDRLIAVVRDRDRIVNQWLVQEGHAWVYRQYARDPQYCRLEQEARTAGRGLWSLPVESRIAPWVWRRRAHDSGHRSHDYSAETLEQCLAAIAHGRPVATIPTSSAPESPLPVAEAPAASGCRIKGNIGARGDRIYHVPGTPSYERTRIDTAKGERWFCTEAEAREHGWHAPRG